MNFLLLSIFIYLWWSKVSKQYLFRHSHLQLTLSPPWVLCNHPYKFRFAQCNSILAIHWWSVHIYIVFGLNCDYIFARRQNLDWMPWGKILKMKNTTNCFIHLNVFTRASVSLNHNLIPWCGLILLSLMKCTHLQRAIVCTAWCQVPQLKS